MSTRRDIEFSAIDGVKLRGWLYPSGTKAPTIIMTQGFSAVKEQYLDDVAARFQAAGFAALVYDNRNFGTSDGNPRFEIDPFKQTEDYHDAFTYAASLEEVNPDRIAFWGTSYSGGNVIQAAAIDRRIKAVIAQTPFVSGEQATSRSKAVIDQVFTHRSAMADKAAVTPPIYVPIVADSLEQAEAGSSKAVLNQPEHFQFFMSLADRAPAWENRITLKSLFNTAKNEPLAFIHRISPTPFLMVVADKDTTIPSTSQLAAYQLAREPKQLHLLRGYGHFDAYSGACLELNLAAQVEFLKKYL